MGRDKKVPINTCNLDFPDIVGSTFYFYNYSNFSGYIGLASFFYNYNTPQAGAYRSYVLNILQI